MTGAEQFLGVRLTEQEAEKLAEIARATGRSKGAVVRILLAQAKVEGYEIRFAPADEQAIRSAARAD